MAKHSSIVGGSTVGRLIACPASFQSTIALPASANKTSEYAEEGTFGHAVLEHVMRYRMAKPKANMTTIAAKLIGTKFHDRVMTEEHFRDMIAPAISSLEELEAEYGGGFTVIAVELSAIFPGVIGAHGTIDLVLQSKTHVLHVDWKFGAGVPVLASYGEGKDMRINDQLMFYLTGCKAKMPSIYKGRQMAVAIIQPRADVMLSYCTVFQRDINQFKKQVTAAVDAALSHGPPRTKGEWCRFAPCKLTCPLWTGPLLDLSFLKVPTASTLPAPKVTPYGEYLSNAKTLVDMLAMYTKEINDQLHAYLEDGGIVPGWRLKAKVKQRQWVDEEVVVKELYALGFTNDQVWQRKLQTFASVDATARRLKVTIPDELRVAPPTNETTIATTDDPAPVVDRMQLTDKLRASLKRLTQG